MLARTLFLGTALIAAGCATAQENPNYRFSSKYDAVAANQPAPVQADVVQTAQAAPVIAAAHPDVVSPTEQAYDADRMIGTPGYEATRVQQQVQAAPPAPVPLYVPAPQQAAPVVTAAPQPAAPTRLAPQGSQPREVTYDYARNMAGHTPAPAPVQAAPAYPAQNYAPAPAQQSVQANVPVQTHYVVQPKDTVYSLSRKLCVPITDVTAPNGIGADFAISIGQTLILPQSRC